MTKTSKIALIIVAAFALAGLMLAFTPTPVSADVTSTISAGIDDAAAGTYDTGGTLTGFAGNLIGALLAVSGVIFLVITVYAGIMYMTAMGDETKVKKGKAMLVQSLLGLIIIIGAYAFTSFIVQEIGDAADAGAPITE